MLLYVHRDNEDNFKCCFTSTETILRTVKDGELRAATSTFTQLLNSDSTSINWRLCVHVDVDRVSSLA